MTEAAGSDPFKRVHLKMVGVVGGLLRSDI